MHASLFKGPRILFLVSLCFTFFLIRLLTESPCVTFNFVAFVVKLIGRFRIANVELTITYTEPGLQGDRSSGGTKPATLETGANIQVPLFIDIGEKVRVDTRDGSYLGRA